MAELDRQLGSNDEFRLVQVMEWRDIVAVARVTDDLDWALVQRWAGMLGV